MFFPILFSVKINNRMLKLCVAFVDVLTNLCKDTLKVVFHLSRAVEGQRAYCAIGILFPQNNISTFYPKMAQDLLIFFPDRISAQKVKAKDKGIQFIEFYCIAVYDSPSNHFNIWFFICQLLCNIHLTRSNKIKSNQTIFLYPPKCSHNPPSFTTSFQAY